MSTPWQFRAQQLRSAASLARWLSPGAAQQVPGGVSRREVVLQGPMHPVRAYVYAPADRKPVGAYLLVHGVHFLGPDDARMDRLARVLAHAGVVSLAPFLNDYLRLMVTPEVLGDVEAAWQALRAQPEVASHWKPGLFSISFGSLPALRLASSSQHAEDVGGLVVFGGYAQWEQTIEYCLTGEIGGVRKPDHDPLNQPVVMLNLLRWLADAPKDCSQLADAIREFAHATWSRNERPAIKDPQRYGEIAQRIGARLPLAQRTLFLKGTRVEPGGTQVCMDALRRSTEHSALLDPCPHLDGLRCPVHLVHGADDDVIPHTQLAALAAAIPPHVRTRSYLTGLYGHTQSEALPRRLPVLAREGQTLLGIVRAMVSAATQRA